MSTTTPMNMLIITSDQHNKHMLGCYGNPKVKTPNLDKLAETGVLFENAYCNSPLCVPSRASMATGAYASTAGYWDNAHAYGGELPSWGTRLTAQRYPVTTIGKLHYRDADPGTGFPDQRIPIHIKNGVGDLYGEIRDREIARLQFRDAIDQAGAGESDYIGYDRAVADQAAEYLKQAGANPGGKPFALYVSFVTPHFPLTVPQQYLDLYPDHDSVCRPVQGDPGDWPHHPVIDDYRRYCGTEDLDEAAANHALRTYYALCTFMDEQVGRVLEALEQAGLTDQTRIIYSSDHGDTMGEHGVYFKSTMYEGSVGVPFIAKGPDLLAGRRSRTNVSLVDIFPSVLECVGVAAEPEDAGLPGASVWDYARGKEDLERTVFAEYYSFGSYTSAYMLRQGDWKYIHYVGERPQLFDLSADPDECFDLAGLAEYQTQCQQLETRLRQVIDPEETDRRAVTAQQQLIAEQGGREAIIAGTSPSLFSPVPV